MPYTVKDVLEILPAGKVRTCPVTAGSISTNCDMARAISPMNQFAFLCIMGNCKLAIQNQQTRLWNNFKKHHKHSHANMTNLKLDQMVIPAAWYEISADKLRYKKKYSLIKIINHHTFAYYRSTKSKFN